MRPLINFQRVTKTAAMIAVVVTALFVFYGPPGLGADTRISITGDGVFSFDGKTWLAIGGVRVVQGDTIIRADRLMMEEGADTALLDGNVFITRGDEEVRGSRFVYDFTDDTGQLDDAVMAFDVQFATESIFLLGETMAWADDITSIEQARFTTCTPPETAGYYLYGQRIDIFPGEKITIRSVRFVESGLTLFYWPYISISLDERRPTRIYFPEIGHNESDGFYARMRFAYDGPGDGFGDILVEGSQYGGFGGGVDHTYRYVPEINSEGRVYVFGRRNYEGTEASLTVRWDEAFPLSETMRVSWRAGTFVESAYGVTTPEYHWDSRVDRSAGRARTTWDVAARYRSLNDGRWALGSRLTHTDSWAFGWRFRSRFDAFLQRTAGVTDKSHFGYLLALSRNYRGVAWRLETEKRLHPSLLTEGGTSTPLWRTFLRPYEAEVTWSLRDTVDQRLPVRLLAGRGRYMEETRAGGNYNTVWADKTSLGFGVVPSPLTLPGGGVLTYDADVRQDTYTTGEQRTIFTVNHRYRWSIGQRSTFTASYALRELYGDDSPFRFDVVRPYETVTARLQYLLPFGSMGLSTGYNLKTHTYSDLLAQLSWRPNARMSMELQGGYAPATGQLTYVAAGASLWPLQGVHVSGNARYDARQSLWDRVSATLAVEHAGWRLEYSGSYNGRLDTYDLGRVALRRDLDCRQIALRYDLDNKSAWFEYMITAFPQTPVGFGLDGGQVRFDADPWLNLFR